MKIIQFDRSDRKRTRQFNRLPFDIYKNIPQWVPPLSTDVGRPFQRDFPFFQHSQAAFLLAMDDHDKPVGRMAVLNNRNYNTFNRDNSAFFWLFECFDLPEAAAALFDSAFAWARSQGLTRIEGPRGFNAMDGAGLLIKGFEHRPAFGLPYHPPYYAALIEAAGFEKKSDTLSGYLSGETHFPAKIHELAERVMERRGLSIARYKKRSDLRAIVPQIKDLYNHSLGDTLDNVPITDEEAQIIADQMLSFADPKLIKIVMKGDQPIGFLFAYPDVSEAVQKIGGRVFPFGWISLLQAIKRTEWVDINGAGIIEEYRGLGGTAILFSEMAKSIQQKQFKHADIVQISADNERMQREMRNFGIDFYKAHRIYQRPL